MIDDSLNVFGLPLVSCSEQPKTGFYRTGCCDTGKDDFGMHTICIIATEEFLEFSAAMGNDLTTPRPEFDFPGLNPGDKWCLCASRWNEAFEFGKAPNVILEATHEKSLEIVSLEDLIKHAHRSNDSAASA